MATTTANYRTSHGGGWLLILLLAVTVITATVGYAYDHAAKHGPDALRAQECFDRLGHNAVYFNPGRDNWLYICQDEGGNIFIRVVKLINGKLEQLTQYRKAGYRSMADLDELLTDAGDVLSWVRP